MVPHLGSSNTPTRSNPNLYISDRLPSELPNILLARAFLTDSVLSGRMQRVQRVAFAELTARQILPGQGRVQKAKKRRVKKVKKMLLKLVQKSHSLRNKRSGEFQWRFARRLRTNKFLMQRKYWFPNDKVWKHCRCHPKWKHRRRSENPWTNVSTNNLEGSKFLQNTVPIKL